MMNRALKLALTLLILNLANGCGGDTRDRENYGDIQNRPGGVEIRSTEHKGGYGRSDCVVCHNISLNVHRGPNAHIDPAGLKLNYETQGGAAYCMTCHGNNGTP